MSTADNFAARVIKGGRKRVRDALYMAALNAARKGVFKAFYERLRAAGLPAPFACKGGVCATCRAKVTAGKVEMKVNYGLSEAELADGYVLTCQATPVSEGVALSYDD